MVTQKEIEGDWKLFKLLITDCVSRKFLSFKMGRNNLYLQDLVPLIPKKQRFLNHITRTTPHIAVVRTTSADNVYQFIREEKEFKSFLIRCKTIASSGLYVGFATDSMKAIMKECDGYTVRIQSNVPEIRDVFYQFAQEAAHTNKLGVRFDYDIYDFLVDVKAYKMKEGGYAFVIIVDFIHKPVNRWDTSTFIHPSVIKGHPNMFDDEREITLEEDADPEVLTEMERKWKDV